jgi:hypothetical protein
MSAIARLPLRTDLTPGLALSDRAAMAERHSAETAVPDCALPATGSGSYPDRFGCSAARTTRLFLGTYWNGPTLFVASNLGVLLHPC